MPLEIKRSQVTATLHLHVTAQWRQGLLGTTSSCRADAARRGSHLSCSGLGVAACALASRSLKCTMGLHIAVSQHYEEAATPGCQSCRRRPGKPVCT